MQRTSGGASQDASYSRLAAHPSPIKAELTAAIGPVTAGAGAAAFAVAAMSLAGSAIARGASPYAPFILITAQVIGVLFLFFGLFVWVRQPNGAGMGRLLVAMGITWYVLS